MLRCTPPGWARCTVGWHSAAERAFCSWAGGGKTDVRTVPVRSAPYRRTGTIRSASDGKPLAFLADASFGEELVEGPPQALIVDLEACPEVCAPEGAEGGGELGDDELLEGDFGRRGAGGGEFEPSARAVAVGDEAQGHRLGGRVGTMLEREA